MNMLKENIIANRIKLKYNTFRTINCMTADVQCRKYELSKYEFVNVCNNIIGEHNRSDYYMLSLCINVNS